MKRAFQNRQSRRLITAMLVLALAASAVLTWRWARPEADAALSDLKPFSLDGYKRLLVLAPHCDDETLGSGGLIQEAVRAGMEVKVVIATNGDGFLFATMQDFQKVYPRPADFIRLGKMRQGESLDAMQVLGLKPEQVTFLSYPDRGTPKLFNEHWSESTPYRSPYDGASQSPYEITFNPGSVYAGEDFLKDLTRILSDYRPDLIVYPHPDDVHPDHWGLNAFTQLALTRIEHADPTYNPTALTYLVHRPDFPEPRGLDPLASLAPPLSIYNLNHDWYKYQLPPADISVKEQAVQAYKSQLPLLKTLLESFVRVDEIFAPAADASLATAAQGDPLQPGSWRDASGQTVPPVELDPASDYLTRDLIPAGDLTALYAATDNQGNLTVCAQVRERTNPGVTYMIRIKALHGEEIATYQARTAGRRSGWELAVRSGVYACTTVPLEQLGNPWAIFVGATTETSARIEDETGWQMISVPGP